MYSSIALWPLVPLAMSQSLVLEAQDGTCGYLNGMKLASYGCHATTQKCAVYYPNSSWAGDTISDLRVASASPTIPSSKTLAPRTAKITPAPQVDYPAVVCCDPSKGDCTAQPTACVDAFEHPYSALCHGSCPNDPMTLKCTAGQALHCNQIEFQSPLYYHRNASSSGVVDALEAGLGVAGGPARGWFCGVSALPTRLVESTIISRRPVFEDEVTRSTSAAAVRGSLVDDDQGIGHYNNLGPVAQATSQSTRLSATVTFTIIPSKQLGAVESAALGLNPSPTSALDPGIVDNGVVSPDDYSYELDAGGGDGCCSDGLASGERCCTNDSTGRETRLQRRRDPEVHRIGITVVTTTVTSPNQIGLVTTTATPAAAPAMVITEGLAIVSATYLGQSDRSLFAEATQSWNVLLPTPMANITNTSKNGTGTRGTRWHSKPKDDLGPIQVRHIVGGIFGGFFAIILLVVLVRWCNRRRKAANERLSNKGVSVEDKVLASGPPQSRVYQWERHTGAMSRLSSLIEDQRGELTPPSVRPVTPGFRFPERYSTSPRSSIPPKYTFPPVQQASSSSSGERADDEGSVTDGSYLSFGSGPYYHAMAGARDDGMREIRPNFHLED